MADEGNKYFVPDPYPPGVDERLADWMMRQLRRITSATQIIEYTKSVDVDAVQKDLDAHKANQDDPHVTLLPWKLTPAPDYDLYPDQVGADDAGIGTFEKAIRHLAIGTQEDPGTGGVEGALVRIEDSDGGGMLVMGIRDVDPSKPPDPPVENAQLWILGNPVALGNQVMIEISQAISDDHEVILGPSTEIDGRHFAPLMLGPEKVYSQQEQATDSTDVLVLDLGEVEILSLTLANTYVVGATFSFQVLLENTGNRETIFDVILNHNGTEVTRYPRSLVANSVLVTDSFPIQAVVNAGDTISIEVEAISTHPQSQGWVRGTLQPTIIRIQQG